MRVFITDTQVVTEWSLIDPRRGCDYLEDYLTNAGALTPWQLLHDPVRNAYVCHQVVFRYWDGQIKAQQALNNRLYDLELQHGEALVTSAVLDFSRGVVALSQPRDKVLEDIHRVLDAAFGPGE